MKSFYKNYSALLEKFKDLPLLAMRLVLAYGFYKPAMMKVKDFESIGQWFESMNYPLPMLNAYLAGITEFVGVFLLLLGLGTRIITVPLMFVMVVAIVTVHGGNGFEASGNGFEIPLYYLIMLFGLWIFGSGRISVDHFLGKKK